MAPRPFEVSSSTVERSVFFGGGFVGAANFVQRGGQAPALKVPRGVLLPVRDGGSLRFELVSFTGTHLSVTKEFITTLPDASDPFTLRFIRP